MALPAGRYGVTKNQLLKIKKLPMNTIKLIEELTEKYDLLGTAAFKNSTSVVTDSSDLVESGAVKDIVGWGNKNLLPNNASSGTINGITFTVNNDGSVTTDGTATANAQIIIYLPSYLSGDYLFSSGLQPAGSDTTYDASVWDYTSNARTKKWDGTTNSNLSFDSSFNETKIVTGHSTAFIFRVKSGNTVNNVVLKPMICRATETDTTYEPYHASVEESKADNSVIGTVENGTTVQKSGGYAVGSHAIRNGAFITWKNAKAQGETINDASDYTSGDVADELDVKEITVTAGTNVSVSSSYNKIYKHGNVIASKIRFAIANAVTSNTVICRVSNVLPIANYPMFDIRTYDAPYLIVGTAFFSPTGDFSIVYDASNPLQEGTYEITFSFICK